MNQINPVCIVALKSNTIINNRLAQSFKFQLKFIVINEGSHTRLIQYIGSGKVVIRILQQKETKHINIYKHIRYARLETATYSKMTFARSLLMIKDKRSSTTTILEASPLGQHFIQNEVDTNKKIGLLSYSYCKKLEKTTNSTRNIWGKSYRLYYEKNLCILIQEFFFSRNYCF
uniref:Chorismate lyase n=1 Tax=Pleurostichidium falkenbergii TaxID=121064 RepID=A0A4D6UVY4_9FLOR|nr:hypothetical protein [Pleurostichidium falkenbergii]QCH39607.1 hypothetical protein [Pleurostichidium falkenbergii]